MFMSDELRRRGMSSTGSKYAVRTARSSESQGDSSLSTVNQSMDSYVKKLTRSSSNLVSPMAKLRNEKTTAYDEKVDENNAHIIKSTTFSVSYSDLQTDSTR